MLRREERHREHPFNQTTGPTRDRRSRVADLLRGGRELGHHVDRCRHLFRNTDRCFRRPLFRTGSTPPTGVDEGAERTLFREGIEACERLLETDPTDAGSYYNLGLTYNF